jgi:heme A synthase
MMRKTYSVLAWIIAGGVFVQAAAIAFGFGGMAGYVQQGGVVDKALVESRTLGNFTGELGFPIHAIVGGLVLPLAGLVLLVISFLVKVRGARKWAAIVFGVVFVQVMIGYSIKDLPYLGLIHGANALAVLLTSVWAARLVGRAGERSEATAVRAGATV